MLLNRESYQKYSHTFPIESEDGEKRITKGGERVAIVGMACRFPGAESIEDFWRLLERGENAVQEGIPGSGKGRVGALFPNDTGQINACRYGAYLDHLDQFDAAFFRISPVEAQLLDPQQRLILETSWRALEDACIDPTSLKDSRTGIYAGISNNDYRGLILDATEHAGPSEPAASLYAVTGTSLNTAIGRVSFTLGLGGAAMAVDTACSSSLVATHQAVAGLQRGDTDLALAGGVNIILSGRLLEFRANAGMLSPDGQCKTFDASANGYVRGEGCGILVLKRLADAEADGDRIWGVIRGSALNQDGMSQGLTVPNGAAQERVIMAALEQAGVNPTDIDYLEAHGTGTEVGDPIEIDAIASVYAEGRDASNPLLIGSVKTNIGHLESAAGVAGLIKTVLTINRGMIPKHLHFNNPNPKMDWERLPLMVTSTPTPWPNRANRQPLAGVSGFGWSGTNAHVILEGYTSPDVTEVDTNENRDITGAQKQIAVSLPEIPVLQQSKDDLAPRLRRVLPLSGKSEVALQEVASRYLDWLNEQDALLAKAGAASDPLLSDMTWTAGTGRSHFDYRTGVVFQDVESLRMGLQAIEGAEIQPVLHKPSKIAFVFTGQASQWPGMGAAIYESEPVVRAVLDRCDAVLQEERGASLLSIMFGHPEAGGDLDDPQWKQPAIYALECALTELWSSLGIRPDIVLGHSLGEIAAGYTAGVFNLEEGLKLASMRGKIVGNLPGEGAMAAVFAPASHVKEILGVFNADTEGIGLCIAADNGAHQVISGPAKDITTILAHLEADGIRVTRLRKSPAYHSPMIEPALDELEAAFSKLSFEHPKIPLVSNLNGQTIGSNQSLDASYWCKQMRSPVAFSACIETLSQMEVNTIVEIGPHSVLGPTISLAWPEASGVREPSVITSLRRPSADEALPIPGTGGGFVEAVAGAFEAGLQLRYEGLFAGETRRRIALPGYPFQCERYWIEAPKRRQHVSDHALLGTRHESASGEIAFDTEFFSSEPSWLADHQVFGRVIAPGALFGAMAFSAGRSEVSGEIVIEDFRMQRALVFPEENATEDIGNLGHRIQVLLDASGESSSRRVQVLSQATDAEDWTLHAEGLVTNRNTDSNEVELPLDIEGLKDKLSPVHLLTYYRLKSTAGINLGPCFQTLTALWALEGEALGEVTLNTGREQNLLDVHPLLLDGCFQIMGAARDPNGKEEGVTYLPFAWEGLRLKDKIPDRIFCHLTMRDSPQEGNADTDRVGAPEVYAGDIRLYSESGEFLGEIKGFTVKQATRAALLSAVEGVEELLYEIVWRDRILPPGIQSAGFLPSPTEAASHSLPFSRYLADEQVKVSDEVELQGEMEKVSWCYALLTLDSLGWERKAGSIVNPEKLREKLGILPEHSHLLRRLLEILARSGVLQEKEKDFLVKVGTNDQIPENMPCDPTDFLTEVTERFPHAKNEIELFKRCAGALPEVLRGDEDPLSLLFGDTKPSAGDLYRLAPVWRAANRMIGEVVRTLVEDLPEGRRLRVLEVGAGIGSATECFLPELPTGRFELMFTDISAGFFADAESRFNADFDSISYQVLDIEKDPLTQGFEPHSYDIVIAANVLHATRHLDETLTHCRKLLAPSGLLVALENQRGRGWMDMIFGQLDGWWRFADRYRANHALAGPEVWYEALGDSGFVNSKILGLDREEVTNLPDRGVIVAQGPAEIKMPKGTWILATDQSGMGNSLGKQLKAQNQHVVLAGNNLTKTDTVPDEVDEFVAIDMENREAWKTLIENLPSDLPFAGVVHLNAQDGHGVNATTENLAADTKLAIGSALALVQGISDADVLPEKGLWFITRGAQLLEKEQSGELVGAALWGLGRVLLRETPQLTTRMLDLDPEVAEPGSVLVNELLFPDSESHIAYRRERRLSARLVRTGEGVNRLVLPDEGNWILVPDEGGAIESLQIQPVAINPLESNEVRVEVEACGLNFLDVFRAMGLVEEGQLGEEFCGRIVEIGSNVASVSIGDRVAGFAFGTFGAEVVTSEDLVALVPPGISVTALATIPSVFVTCLLSFELVGLKQGDRVLIHAGAGGVGLAAIQLAQAAGSEVFATASAPKQAYLRNLGVEHVFDSRSTEFGQEILDATNGVGVDVVLNSLTGEGFIESSFSCLAKGGRFVELARRDILSEDEVADLRPDVAYSILDLYKLKQEDPARVGEALQEVLTRMGTGELKPLPHTRWPLAETSAAMSYMRAARHIGKIVLTTPSLRNQKLRQDGTYLVTGGLGGIGCALAEWLAEHGAGTVVLNGRRPPDPEAVKAIKLLRDRGFKIEVEIADVTDSDALDTMFSRLATTLPPLVGVFHSVGILSDATIGNQSWESFETVLWPKMLGAWHLHRATKCHDLDMFVLFSSVAGILGNPGQANHAAANTFLDQLAAHRRSLGLPGQAIAWGAWSELGEAEEQRERIAERREASGTGWFTPEKGFKALELLLRLDKTNSVVAEVDWPIFGDSLGSRPMLLEDLLAGVSGEGDELSLTDDLLAKLSTTPAAGREDILVSFLQQEVQAVLRLPTLPPANVGFFELGMDSLMAVELRNRINRAFEGCFTVPNTLIFDYPDIEVLAQHLKDEFGEPESAPITAPDLILQPPEHRDDGIAIVGMACRFPGAPDLTSFWQQLKSGFDAVTDGRQDNGAWSGVAGDPTAEDGNSNRGGFVDEIDYFDAHFFDMTPIGAGLMDPQQRLLLETSWRALEDAGINPEKLKGSRTGIYAGLATSEYRDLMLVSGADLNYLGTASGMAVGGVAYKLGLTGPAIPVMLNCASSLISVQHAVTGLRKGEVNLALVGGVNTVFSPGLTKEMAFLGMLSKHGHCNTFDASADGFVRGEGCGMLILKRLVDAETDGDRIWAVIHGAAVNQNGATAGPTTPNGLAQERVIEEALAQSGFRPSDIDYLEAHGAGSELGDPIEVQAAARVYGNSRESNQPLLIGSVKTNLGHLEAAAGTASLIKVVLSMHHGLIPKNLHFNEPSPHIDWNQLPVSVVTETMEWPSDPNRQPRAGVSAFGISGANAHIVVEGYGPLNQDLNKDTPNQIPFGALTKIGASLPKSVPLTSSEESYDRQERMLPLSAKSNLALSDLAKLYLAWIEEHELTTCDSLDEKLGNMAWTASVGRNHFTHRNSIIFKDIESLKKKLKMLVDSESDYCTPTSTKLAFYYPDESCYHSGMGKELYEQEPVVRSVLDYLDGLLNQEYNISLLSKMFDCSKGDDNPTWTQPAVYALECSLTALWSSIGIQPNVVFGMGLGEISAAQAAGVMSLEEGLKLAVWRGFLMEANQGEIKPNETNLAELNKAVENIAFETPLLSLLSNKTGRIVGANEKLDSGYWEQHIYGTKEFGRYGKTLSELNTNIIIEMGNDTELRTRILPDWPKPNGSKHPIILPSLSRSSPMGNSFLESVAKLYESGLTPDFSGLYAGEEQVRISLPSYPFQRQRFWFDMF